MCYFNSFEFVVTMITHGWYIINVPLEYQPLVIFTVPNLYD